MKKTEELAFLIPEGKRIPCGRLKNKGGKQFPEYLVERDSLFNLCAYQLIFQGGQVILRPVPPDTISVGKINSAIAALQ